MMKKLFVIGILACLFFLQGCGRNKRANKEQEGSGSKESYVVNDNKKEAKPPLEIGYALALKKLTLDTLVYSKSVGVEHIEISGLSLFVSGDREFKFSDKEIEEKLTQAKKAADKAGINIWSVHMPFGPRIDLSLIDEKERKAVVTMHQKLLKYLEILKPEIILFHPSYYLGLGEREERKEQLLNSALVLNKDVQEIGAVMVIENMLGPKLLVDEDRERPLMRTVEESVEIFSRLPKSIGLTVDTNHILHAEELILALGDRLKSLHIADGTGEAENHWFPCGSEGKNDWNKVLGALENVNYKGPFMYESSPEDVKQYKACYNELYRQYAEQKQ